MFRVFSPLTSYSSNKPVCNLLNDEFMQGIYLQFGISEIVIQILKGAVVTVCVL